MLHPTLQFLRYALLSITVLVCASALSEENRDPVFSIDSNKPPAGFEQLATRQTTQVDIYYQNNLLTSVLATYDFETIEFQQPEEIVFLIDDLLDPEQIVQALSAPLPVNADLLCVQYVERECGILDPAVAGVIFDESRFRADLFINPLQLAVNPAVSNRYLPGAVASASMLHALDINAAGNNREKDRFNIQSNSVLAYGASRLRAQLNYTDEEQFAFDEMSFQRDTKQWELEAGIFGTTNRLANFLSEQDILGARVRSSINTRTDLDVAQGTPILLFLNQRSRVEVFKDGRLIDARFYDAGNQELDTSRFPDGAYEITVVTSNDGGQSREETFFFVRSNILPPKGEDFYFFEAGEIQELIQSGAWPDSTTNHLIRAGASHRLFDSLGLEEEIAQTDGQTMAQIGLLWFLAGMQNQITTMYTSESDWGVSLRHDLRTDPFALSLDYRHVEHDDDDDNNLDEDGFDFVTETFTQATGSLSHDLLGGRAFWRYRVNERDDAERIETYSFRYSKPLYRQGIYEIDWDFEGNKDRDDYLVRAGITLTIRNNKREYRVNPTLLYQDNDAGKHSELVGKTSFAYLDTHERLGRTRSTVFHNKERDLSTSGLRFQSDSTYGYNELEANYTNNQRNQDVAAYSASSRFGLVSDFNTLAFGGRNNETSAIIIDLIGLDDSVLFEVFINRQSYGFAEVGKKTVITLRPYQTYDVRLASRGEAFVDFDQNTNEVTLYPGNVTQLNWNVTRQLVYIGQVVDTQGRPVKNGILQDLGGFSITDDNGWFQIESTPIEAFVIQKSSGERCTVTFPDYNDLENLIVFDELLCK